MVKVNSIILPGINEDHIEAVARRVADLGVDLFNAMPYYPNAGSEFEHLAEPDKTTVENDPSKSGRCMSNRCAIARAAAPMPSVFWEKPLMRDLMNTAHRLPAAGCENAPVRPGVAASLRGRGQHGRGAGEPAPGRSRKTVGLWRERGPGPTAGSPCHPGKRRRHATLAGDGRHVVGLQHAAGQRGGNQPAERCFRQPASRCWKSKDSSMKRCGLFLPARTLNHMTKRTLTACGKSCSGNGMGCG